MPKVWVDGQERQTTWVFDRAEADAVAGTVTLTFTHAAPKLTLRSIWRARPGRGPIEHWIELENRSGGTIAIPQQESLALRFLRPGGASSLWWIKRGASNASVQGGTYTEPATPGLNLTLVSNCEDGASPVPWLAIQVGQEQGLYVGWEFSGVGGIHAKADKASEGIEVDIGLNPDFKTDVESGETFVVPPAFVGCYAGDIDEGSYSLHRFVLEKLQPPVPEGFTDPTLAYNLYLDAGGDKAKEDTDLPESDEPNVEGGAPQAGGQEQALY